jgi:membrane protein
MGYSCRIAKRAPPVEGVRARGAFVADSALAQTPPPVEPPPADSATAEPTRRTRIAPWYWAAVVLRVSGRAAKNFAEDRGTQMAAAISYYTLFSLLPLLVLSVAIFGLVLRDNSLQVQVIDSLIDTLPIQNEDIIETVQGTTEIAPQLALVALLGAIWTSGALSASLRMALNVAFEARRTRPAVRGKLIDYALLPILGLPVLGSVVISAAWQIIRQRTDNLPLAANFEWVWDVATLSTSLVLSFLAFSLLYWLAPNRTVRFRYLWPGALFAAVAFEALKYGFTVYLTNFANYEVVYGALGGVVVLLFWVFLSANILILGAEIANEVPHVLYEEPRHGRERGREDRSWVSAVWKVLRWFLLAPEDEEDHLPPGSVRPQPGDIEENGTHIDRTRHRRRSDRRAEQEAERAETATEAELEPVER